MRKKTDRTTQYAKDVLDGKHPAGELVKLACQRHLNDLESSKAESCKWFFDVDEANKIINFAEMLTIVEGVEKKQVKAFEFQCFILGSLAGWRAKEGHYRRFRTSYIQMGRQNGKSFLNGVLATYYGNFDRYKYGQIYCTATKSDQASIVFNEVAHFIDGDDDMKECFRVHEHDYTIDCLLTHSTIRALSGDTKRIDGFRPYLGIVDEYHAHATNQMYKLLEGGIKQMDSALISVITTAGFSMSSPCRSLYEYCVKILRGITVNDTQFVYIAQMDENDDIWTPANWIKANPMLEYRPNALANMIPIAASARDMGGSDLRDFIVKQLNMWLQWSDDVYIKDLQPWLDAADKNLSLADFTGQKCYVGLDLSSGGDLTSLAVVIPHIQDGSKKYYVHAHSFIPKNRVEEHIKTDDVPYDLWIKQGLLTVTETLGGIKTDYKYIISYLLDLINTYQLDVQYICYDPHNASAFLADLENMGVDSLSITQSARNLNDATVDFQLEVQMGNVRHDGNGALTWSLSNAKTVKNSFGEIKIEKELRTERIDVVDAIIDAWTEAMRGDVKPDANDFLNLWLEQTELYSEKEKKGEEMI